MQKEVIDRIFGHLSAHDQILAELLVMFEARSPGTIDRIESNAVDRPPPVGAAFEDMFRESNAMVSQVIDLARTMQTHRS